jgi:group I intron endonuclease
MPNRRFIIYVVVNKNNGKLYVGQSRRHDPIPRLLEHFRHAINYGFNSCPYFYPAIRKHGKESFYVFEAAEAFSQEELDKLETEWILRLGTLDHSIGYNVSEGGSSPVPSQETLAKRSAALKDVPKSEEHKRKISEANKGRPSHFKGKKMSSTRYAAIKASGAWDKGRKRNYTPESLERIKHSRSGENNPLFRSDIDITKVIDLQKSGLSLRKIAKIFNTSHHTISSHLSLGKQ